VGVSSSCTDYINFINTYHHTLLGLSACSRDQDALECSGILPVRIRGVGCGDGLAARGRLGTHSFAQHNHHDLYSAVATPQSGSTHTRDGGVAQSTTAVASAVVIATCGDCNGDGDPRNRGARAYKR